jgi:hypothetical protein
MDIRKHIEIAKLIQEDLENSHFLNKLDLTHDDVMDIEVTDEEGNASTVGDLLNGASDKSSVYDIDVTYDGETYTIGELLKMIGELDEEETKKWAKCEICGKEMSPNNTGCWSTLIDEKGKQYKRQRYGDEGGDTAMPCGDCNATAGSYHHDGCDMENCPKCGGQLLGCGCNFKSVGNMEEDETTPAETDTLPAPTQMPAPETPTETPAETEQTPVFAAVRDPMYGMRAKTKNIAFRIFRVDPVNPTIPMGYHGSPGFTYTATEGQEFKVAEECAIAMMKNTYKIVKRDKAWKIFVLKKIAEGGNTNYGHVPPEAQVKSIRWGK